MRMKTMRIGRLAGWLAAALILVTLTGCANSIMAGGQREMAGLTILVDPGHGDTDPGTIGPQTGVHEKDINLQIALKLKAALEAEGVHVVMTRADDRPLGDPGEQDISVRKESDMLAREAIIEETKANLLVSVHQNQFEDPSVKGPQVFYLKTPDGKSYGEAFANSLQDAINGEMRVENPRKTGAGNWRLLKKGNQPGCIVECGFFSNPEEELLLQTEDYQDQLVSAITKGIQGYVGRYGA